MLRACLVLMLGAGAAYGQPKAQICGFVRDSSGAVVSSSPIAVMNLDTGVRRSTLTNGEGFYAISSLTPGQYKITVRKPGFQTVARTGVQLHAMDASRLDFTLEVGSVHEEITVEGAVPLMNFADASYGMQMGREPADSLPLNGRGLQALIDLAPGVLTTPATAGESGQFSANGQRPATNYFTVDGVSANNGVSGSGLPGQFSGGALPAMTAIGSLHNLLSIGELDELRVETSTFAPEYGRLPGAQVAVTTRSGSNDWHGEVFASLRHERLASSDWLADRAGLGTAKQRLLDSGGGVGGPIRRNQTFFLVSSEFIRLRQPLTYRLPVPSAAARAAAPSTTRGILNAYPLPNGPNLGSAGAMHTAQFVTPSEVSTTSIRLDQALGGSGTLFVRYNRTPSENRAGYLQANQAEFRSQTVTAGVVAVLTPRLTNDARLGVSRTAVDSTWLPAAATINLRSMLPNPGEGQKLYGIGIRGYPQLLTGDSGYSHQNQWNLTDSLAFTTGRHDVRLGIDYQRLSPERDRPIAAVTTVYDSVAQLVAGMPAPYAFAQTGGGSSLLETLSIFAQDTWHATPRLNVTYGLRWELTPAPSYRGPSGGSSQVSIGASPTTPLPPSSSLPQNASSTPNWKTRMTQFAPRIGAAYRLNDSGSLVLRAGAGLFYDLGFSSAVDLVNGAPYNRWRSGIGVALLGFDVIEYGFARDLRLPYTTQWNVTLDRALGGNSAASVAYVGSLGRRLLRREGQLAPNRSNPNLVLATNHGDSEYHSLQVHYRTRSFRGLLGTVSYTWAHAIDNGSWDSATWILYGGQGAGQDRGSSNFDMRHNFQAALSYDLGRTRLPYARGWRLSGTLRARTGFPIDVLTTEHPFGLGFDNQQRPDLVPGVPLWLNDPTAPSGRILNPKAFTVPPAGRQGALGRNSIRGNGLTQLDAALDREFVLGERARFQLRLEAYNVANTTNFGDPVRVMASPLFGQSVSLTNLMLGAGRPNSGLTPAFQSGGPRMLQAGVTFRF